MTRAGFYDRILSIRCTNHTRNCENFIRRSWLDCETARRQYDAHSTFQPTTAAAIVSVCSVSECRAFLYWLCVRLHDISAGIEKYCTTPRRITSTTSRCVSARRSITVLRLSRPPLSPPAAAVSTVRSVFVVIASSARIQKIALLSNCCSVFRVATFV